MKVIAETASNHNGEIEYLKELTLQCWEAGASLVTIQIFKLDAFVNFTDSSYETFKKIEIAQNDWENFFDWSNANNIQVLPCILDEPSMELCYSKGIRKVKIHASDILNTQFLKKCDEKFDAIFLEFGGATMEEIQNAISSFSSSKLVLLYGFNAYPTKIENQNLEFISSLKNLFDVEVGFCDHTLETDIIPIMAMSKGAKYLEKHVTLDQNNHDRFDWEVSVEPEKLRKIINNIRTYMPAIGEKLRLISDSENNFRKLVYKKLLARRDIKIGEFTKHSDFEFKRGILGIESKYIDDLLNKKLIVGIKKGEPITIDKLEV